MAGASERFLIEGDRLVFEAGTNGAWSLDISRIAAIGEHTVATWPGQDDRWEVFVDDDGDRYQVPAGVGAWRSVRESLRGRIGACLEPTPLRSSKWAHVILWPSEVAGMPLFKVAGSKIELSDELHAFLRRRQLRQAAQIAPG